MILDEDKQRITVKLCIRFNLMERVLQQMGHVSTDDYPTKRESNETTCMFVWLASGEGSTGGTVLQSQFHICLLMIGEKPYKQPNPPFPHYSDKFKLLLEKTALPLNPEPPSINPQPHPHSPPPPPQYDLYRVRVLGLGAHASVHLVEQDKTHTLFAQKAIKKSHGRQILPLLLREIKTMYFIDHENLIKLYRINLLMEFAQDSLFNLKTKFKVFKEKEIIQVLRQLLHGLNYLHTRGIVHADVKLENVMIANGVIKLVDFGYAYRFPLESSKEIVGTVEYLAPEYARGGEDSGPKRDIWAVGILGFEMLVGKNPFDGLRQNEKWSKIVNQSPEAYLTDLHKTEAQLCIKSQKIELLLQKIFCPAETRWSAQQLLSLQFFKSP